MAIDATGWVLYRLHMPKLNFKTPKLTQLEQFVWDNQDRHLGTLASETNRDEATISRAYSRAYNKIREIQAIKEIRDREKETV